VRLLLDVNVWVALFDDAHIHNTQAFELFQRPELKITTCALTENGVLRVSNLPGCTKRATPGFEAVRQKLTLACHNVDHAFWPCGIMRGMMYPLANHCTLPCPMP
jgi:predicted nucleic acid-binding protein